MRFASDLCVKEVVIRSAELGFAADTTEEDRLPVLSTSVYRMHAHQIYVIDIDEDVRNQYLYATHSQRRTTL